jgi:hypothetical protein
LYSLFIPFLIIFLSIYLLKGLDSSYANKLSKAEIETINVNLFNNTNFTVEIDKINENINIIKDSNKICEDYINVDVEKTTAVLSNSDKTAYYSTSDYINIFNSVKPYIDTNMSYMYLLSLYNFAKEVKIVSINLLQKYVQL